MPAEVQDHDHESQMTTQIGVAGVQKIFHLMVVRQFRSASIVRCLSRAGRLQGTSHNKSYFVPELSLLQFSMGLQVQSRCLPNSFSYTLSGVSTSGGRPPVVNTVFLFSFHEKQGPLTTFLL